MNISISDPLVQIISLILVLILAWSVARFLLRLTLRIFSCGLSLILLIGLVLYLLQILEFNF